MLRDPITLGIATAATWISVASALTQILCHLRNYTEPLYQRYIIRIIFLVPFYGVTSWLSIMYREESIYFDVPRDCYEAWVIYNFLSLCMAYVGGPGAVVVKSEGKYIKPSWALMTCCWPPIKVDGFLLRKCKQGTLQFVIAKPILAAFTLILFAAGMYEDGDWSITGGYLYIAIIYNTCYTIALYYLLIFYVGCEELLEPYRPLLKIIVIKAVIFLTFWQSIAISMFSSRFTDPSDAAALQDWMVCIEMLISAAGMWVAFPHTEYKMGGQTTGWRLHAFLHAISLQDVYSDIMHQFNPNYKTYVLYSDGGPSENVKRKKFRAGGKKQTRKRQSKNNLSAMEEGAARGRTRARGSSGGGRQPVMGSANEEGEEWNPPSNVRDKAAAIFGKPGTGKGMLGWLPSISEKERKQAVLVDSDSDAEYDDDNEQETALDHTMLAASSGSDEEDLARTSRGRTSSTGGPASSTASRSPSRRRSSGAGDEATHVSPGQRGSRGPKQQLRAVGQAANVAFKRIESIARDARDALHLEDSDDDDRML
ncbi:hypothetical protein HXX76_000399 [Chlamydomonas incerta]|uniref:Uncharacterized protein n=1 Tax=Chlamydomonas incerta TaxID=51695 RepID=A0A835WE70_CHLIN|nr:hypothetical protein HXX76_000399 [Chlamydomonas incerta]|eukprot:KAG2445795.1 hypothetical protein HXX76_000399 [Chlamydomonas incerta]